MVEAEVEVDAEVELASEDTCAVARLAILKRGTVLVVSPVCFHTINKCQEHNNHNDQNEAASYSTHALFEIPSCDSQQVKNT